MSVFEGVRLEVEALPLRLQRLGVASLALAMAARIDEGKGSPSECGKVLMDALRELRSLAPAKKEHDLVDHLAARRAKRRSAVGGSKAAAGAGS